MEIIHRYHHNESKVHYDSKNQITDFIQNSKGDIIFRTPFNGDIHIKKSNIKVVIQEYQWFLEHRKKFFESFSADIVILDNNDKILLIIEIVYKSNLSNRKYNFYRMSNIPWVEIDAKSTYKNLKEFKTNQQNLFETVQKVYPKEKYKIFGIDTKKYISETEANIDVKTLSYEETKLYENKILYQKRKASKSKKKNIKKPKTYNLFEDIYAALEQINGRSLPKKAYRLSSIFEKAKLPYDNRYENLLKTRFINTKYLKSLNWSKIYRLRGNLYVNNLHSN